MADDDGHDRVEVGKVDALTLAKREFGPAADWFSSLGGAKLEETLVS
jgi:hypothetical protein